MIGVLKVSPAQMISAAQNFSTQGNTVSNLTNQMTQLVQGLSSVWTGEASQAYMAKFNQLNDDIQRLIKMVNEHATDLQEMASVYTNAEETQIMSDINTLVGDVIV